MKCKVMVRGKNNEDFQKLSAVYGKLRALEIIASPEAQSASIEGFTSDVEIANRVNGLSFLTLKHLREQAGALSYLDLHKGNLDKSSVEKALDKSYEDLMNLMFDALKDAKEANFKEESLRAVRATYAALQNFEELEPKIKERIEGFGLELSDIENDNLAEYYKEESENNKQRIYAQDHYETSRLDSLPVQVKLYLATVPKHHVVAYEDGTTGIEEVVDDIGMEVPNDFHDTYSMLSKTLANSSSFEEMLDRMGELGEDIPTIQAVYEDLKYDLVGTGAAPIKLHGKTINNFENAFFTAFKNNNAKFATLSMKRSEKQLETGEKVYEKRMSTFETNKRRHDKVIRDSWMQNYSQLLAIPAKERQFIWNNAPVGTPMAEFFATKNATKTARKLDNQRNTVILHELSEILNESGISMSVKALSRMRKSMNKGKDKSKFSKEILTNSHSLRTVLEKFWNQNINSLGDETTLLQTLSRFEAEVSKEVTGGAFMNGEGNMVYPINLPTAASELFDDLFGQKERLDSFLEDPLMENFHILNRFRKTKNNGMEMRTLDTIYDADLREGVPYNRMDPMTSTITRLGFHMGYNQRGGINNKMGWYLVPTPADRSSSRLFRMPKMQDTKWIAGKLRTGDFKDWLQDTAASELERIKLVRSEYKTAKRKGDLSGLIVNYHYNTKTNELGTGGYFQYYPELNELLPEDLSEDIDLDINSEEVSGILEKAAYEQYKADVDYLVEVGVLQPTTTYSNLQPTKLASNNMPAKLVSDDNIQSFIANSMVANLELSTIFTGDLAHFKNHADANKRSGLTDTPGTKLRIGQNGANPTFRVAFVNDLSFDSDYTDSYKEAIGAAHGKKYDGIEVTDGQGFVSLDRYADILAGQGKLTPAMAITINELKKQGTEKDPIDWSKVTEQLQPIKGFLQGQRFDPVFERIMPQNLKYSLLPVIPSAISDNPMMKTVHSKMSEARVDELVFATGSKYGAYNISDLDSDSKLNTVVMSNLDWRMPQVVPYKTKVVENFGTQIRKIITGNVNKDATYGDKSGFELLDTYQRALAGNLRNDFVSLFNSLSTDGSIDVKKVAEKVKKGIARNVYSTTPGFVEQALGIVNDDTRVPMSHPAIKYRVESTLNSAVRKSVTKQSIPGFAAVQYAAVGFGKESISRDKFLRFVRKEDGVVKPAEIKVSPQYFIQSLLQKTKNNPSPEIQELIDGLISGDVDMNAFSDELLTGVLYRIPTQGKNSMLPFKIVGFTPEALGSTIVIPAELTTQSGADYDIDKVYLEMRHFDLADNKMTVVKPELTNRKGRDNIIVNTHYEILTSPEHFGELITPNHSDTLNKMSEKYSRSYEGRKWNSVATQDDFRDKNQAGGIMIGVFSIANTAHALFQELGVQLKNRFEGDDSVKGLSLADEQFYEGNLDIKTFGDNDVFVFGANTVGGHGGGTAAIAQTGKSGMSYTVPDRKTGHYAVYGETGYMEGFKGNSYGLVTKEASISGNKLKIGGPKSVSREQIINNISEMYQMATAMPEKTYYVAYRNTGRNMNGYTSTEMREMFSEAGNIPSNVKFSADWKTEFTQQSEGVKVAGKERTSLSLVKNDKGGLISDDHMEAQTASVDNAKNPVLGNLNINTVTGNVYNFLIEVGTGIEYASKLVGSPVIRELTKLTRQYEISRGSEGAFQEAIKDISAKVGVDVSDISIKDFDVQEITLDEAWSKFESGEDHKLEDAEILSAYLTFRKYGQNLVAVQQALQTDNIGAHQTLAANFIHQQKLAKVKGTYNNSIKNEVTDEIQTITLDRDAYSRHSMESYEKFGLNGAVTIVGSVIDDTKPAQTQLLADYERLVGGQLHESDLRLLMNDFYSYLFLNYGAHEDVSSVLADDLDSDVVSELLVGPDSLGKRVLELQEAERRKQEEDVSYIPNEFVMNLTVELNNEVTGFDLVKFNNTVSRALSSEQKTTLANEWVRLARAEETSFLAGDLLRYEMAMNGFNRGVNSFGDYLHVDLYEAYTDDNGVNLIDFYREVRPDFSDPTKFNLADFKMRFFKNRLNDLKGLPDLSGRGWNVSRIKTYLKQNPNVNYFKVKSNAITEGKALASNQGDGKYVILGEAMGNRGINIEYFGGDPISGYKNIQEALEEAKKKKDVYENGCS